MRPTIAPARAALSADMKLPSGKKFVQTAATAAVAAALIFGTPSAAMAKGGGHGGGSHSSHSSSHVSMSRSYTPRSTSSRSSSSPSSSRSSSRSSSSSRRSSGSSSSSGYSSSRTYVGSSPPPTVVIDDTQPNVIVRTPARQAYWNGVGEARTEALTIAFFAYMLWDSSRDGSSSSSTETEWAIDYQKELKETKELMTELKMDIVTKFDPLELAIDKPVDGKYSGESAEDDGGDQGVSTDLKFALDGTISGEGYDAVDGSYTIHHGRWAGKRVAWIEEYAPSPMNPKGFQVALRGQVRPDGTILGIWASSMGIGGSVELKP